MSPRPFTLGPSRLAGWRWPSNWPLEEEKQGWLQELLPCPMWSPLLSPVSSFLVSCALASLQNYDLKAKQNRWRMCKSSGSHLCFDVLTFCCSYEPLRGRVRWRQGAHSLASSQNPSPLQAHLGLENQEKHNFLPGGNERREASTNKLISRFCVESNGKVSSSSSPSSSLSLLCLQLLP